MNRRRFQGYQPYGPTLEAMRALTLARTPQTPDELWFLEHAPVFTQGQAGKPEHILCAGDIPVVQSCRGGQVTYHGPGQLMVYTLLDLERRNLGVRAFVSQLEHMVINLLADWGIQGHLKDKAPGVYVDDHKIASLGLRVRQGRCYHGLSLNVAMDLEPFSRINPCGYAGMPMTQLSEFVPGITIDAVIPLLESRLLATEQIA